MDKKIENIMNYLNIYCKLDKIDVEQDINDE